MLAIIFALVSFLGWGTGDIFTTLGSRKIGSFNASFYGYLFGILLLIFYIPFALDSLKNFTLPMILLTGFLAVIQLISFLAYNEALKIGNSSLVGTIAGAFTSLVVIFSIMFLGESLSTQQVMAIVIIFLGLFLSSVNFADLKSKKIISDKGILYALAAMLGWGIYFTFIKIPVQHAGFFWPTFGTGVTAVIVFLILGFKRIKPIKLNQKNGFISVFIASILLTTGSLGFSLAIGKGLSSVIAPIAGAYPALFAILASLIFKDPITKQQKVGIIITLVGIILLSYFSR